MNVSRSNDVNINNNNYNNEHFSSNDKVYTYSITTSLDMVFEKIRIFVKPKKNDSKNTIKQEGTTND